MFCCSVNTAPDRRRVESPDFARVETPFAIATVIVDTATCAGALLQTKVLRCCQSRKCATMLCVGAMFARSFGPRVRKTRFGRCRHLGASAQKRTRINVTEYPRISNIIGTINSVTNLPIGAPKDAVQAARKRHCARVVPLATREHQGATHPLRGSPVACGATLTQ